MGNASTKALVWLAILLACSTCAFALDPSLEINQYAHTAWKVRDGFTKGAITSIAQTPDGYLWLGMEFGLVRFDGVRAVPWQPPGDQHLPTGRVFSLLVARDGTLWIGTKGLASWKTASLLNIRSLLTSLFSEYLRIARARYGLAVWAPQLPEGSVRFPVAASVASEMMVVSATACSAYMRTAGVISGWESKTGCGDGSLVLRSSIRCPVKWTVYKPSVKTLMAHFWSGGRAESTGF